VYCNSVRIAGDEMDEAIIKYIREKYNVLISESAAEEVKWTLGSAFPSELTRTMEVSGRDQFEGLSSDTVTASVDFDVLHGSDIEVQLGSSNTQTVGSAAFAGLQFTTRF